MSKTQQATKAPSFNILRLLLFQGDTEALTGILNKVDHLDLTDQQANIINRLRTELEHL